MSNVPNGFLVKNWQIVLWFVIAVFTAGGIFAEFTSLKNELTTVHTRRTIPKVPVTRKGITLRGPLF